MAPVSLCDELTIEPNESETGLAFSSDDPSLPAGEENLVVRAARAFFTEIEAEPRVRIQLRKKIPHGAGLGGGSSDAASMLLGLQELHGRPLSDACLTNMAAGIGSDVPFFLARSAAICRGRGEIVEPVGPLPDLSAAFETGVWGADAVGLWAVARCARAAGRGLRGAEDRRADLQNDLERPVFEKHLFLARMKVWLREQPEVAAALLSGSGSTLFAVLRDGVRAQPLAERARAELDPALWSCAAQI